MPARTARPPAGWYADAQVPDGERYFDGTDWTDRRRPASPADVPESDLPAPRPGDLLEDRGSGLVGAVVRLALVLVVVASAALVAAMDLVG